MFRKTETENVSLSIFGKFVMIEGGHTPEVNYFAAVVVLSMICNIFYFSDEDLIAVNYTIFCKIKLNIMQMKAKLFPGLLRPSAMRTVFLLKTFTSHLFTASMHTHTHTHTYCCIYLK